MIYRITPEKITYLNSNEVFVFGSNESGRHGKGAAKTAMKWGAVYGQAEGLQGMTYGIPTVNATITDKLPIEKIKYYVNNFLDFAMKNQYTFLVTPIGTGLAGWTIEDIAPLFRGTLALTNVYLPKRFWDYYYM